ncbi:MULTISPECIES: hypothetical protein [Streptomyces]|uniref:Uncharacterized protein n=1 Tax=Streptomyces apricus TaxID=1828112 RepID=A0A5B0BEV3_9ACTN|nr:hypothetical protein [Streptomyces apricus]KAA0940237.1 hypothetical protein FGF04_10625 [Streptomyces apricus]
MILFDPAEGAGLIAAYGSDERVPFQAWDIRFVDAVTEGQPVIYAIERVDAALRAVEVRPA